MVAQVKGLLATQGSLKLRLRAMALMRYTTLMLAVEAWLWIMLLWGLC
jgi:hypothetical protein